MFYWLTGAAVKFFGLLLARTSLIHFADLGGVCPLHPSASEEDFHDKLCAVIAWQNFILGSFWAPG